MSNIKNSNVIIKERKRWLFLGLPLTFTTYTLTDKKLILKQGFFSTNEDEILLYRILDISKRRSFLEKITGIGTLEVYSSDKTNPQLQLVHIRHVDEFHTFLSENVEKERLRVKFRAGEIINRDSDDHFDHDDSDDVDDFML